MSDINPSAYLVINSQIFALDKTVTRIGRKIENDLVIQDPLISRSHAEIHQMADGYFLIDLNSTTGTHLNNQRITRHKLNSGDLFYLANIPIMFIEDNPYLQGNLNKNTGTLDLPKEEKE
ncbi:MAG: FHA domain-containing protein [Anaerolineales bacterium]|nr:FHA domain-containing protein [Anaerolineales bacterium]